jgi:hypothetical protein
MSAAPHAGEIAESLLLNLLLMCVMKIFWWLEIGIQDFGQKFLELRAIAGRKLSGRAQL